MKDMRHFLRRTKSIVRRGLVKHESTCLSLKSWLRRYWRSSASSLRQSQTLATYVPRWVGVRSATLNLFDRCLPLPLNASRTPDTIGQKEIETYAAVISALPIKTLVISGGDRFALMLLKEVRLRRRDIDGRLLWHSNFLQMGDEDGWKHFKLWLDAAHKGHISRFGVVKKGLDDFLNDFGVSSVFVQNRVRTVPDAPPDYIAGGIAMVRGSSGCALPRRCLIRLCGLVTRWHHADGSRIDGRALSLIKELGLRHDTLEQERIPRRS